MRISNIIGILGLAAMLFLVAIAAGVAHADEGPHHPYYSAYDIEHIHDRDAQSVLLMYVSDAEKVTMYRWEDSRDKDCFTRIYPGSGAHGCVKAHDIERKHDGHVQRILVAVREYDGDTWSYIADSTTPDGYYKALNQEVR